MARTSKDKPGPGLGDAIHNEVLRRNVTLERASTDLGLAGNTLSRWSSGIMPGAKYYVLLEEFLGVTQDELGALIIEDQVRRWGFPRS